MVVQRFITVLLMVVLVGLVRAEDAKKVVIAGIKAKKITWKKSGAKMVLIPANPSGWNKSHRSRVC